MKKIVLLLVIVAFGVGYFMFSKTSKLPIGPLDALKENLTTSNKQVKNMGGDLPFPLKVNGEFNIKLFSNVSATPRVLAFDPNGVLFASIPSAGKIVALPDKDQNGIADEEKQVITNLNSPHGIEFDGEFVYIGETDKVTRYKYDSSTMTVSARTVLFSLPSGGRHTTRTVKVSGGKLYVSVGSSCDVCIEKENRADVWVSNLDGSDVKVFAKGLRNTVFFNFDSNGQMWGTDMGRDFLGDNLPPEEVNLIEGPESSSGSNDYGWPYCYGNKIRDSKFMPGENSDYCANTIGPKFEMPAHIAPLGITFDPDGNILVAQHGSWNSSVPVGYKVVKINKNGEILSNMQDFITGFISGSEVLGRPVDLVLDKNNNLFVSDDKADNIYIVTPN